MAPVTAVVRAWQRFWFPALPVRRLAAFRLVLVGYALYDVWLRTGFISRYARVDEEFYDPIVLTRLLGDPHLSPGVTSALYAVLVVALVMGFVGLFTRPALIVAAVLHAWWFATFYSYGGMAHNRIPTTMALIVCAVAPAGAAYSLDAVWRRARRADPVDPIPAPADDRDPLAGWALRMMMVLVVVAYVVAAITKIRTSGFDWPAGGALEEVLVEKNVPFGLFIARQGEWAMFALGVATLALEATAIVVIFGARWRNVYLAVAAAFHLGIYLTLRINFLALVLAYLAFFELEIAAGRIARWARRVGARWKPLEVTYDGACLVCVRSMTVLVGLDWFGRLRLIDGTASGQPLPAMLAGDGRRVASGFYAFRRVARALPLLWPLWLLGHVPGVPLVGVRVYEAVARNRGRMGVCAVGGEAAAEVASSAS